MGVSLHDGVSTLLVEILDEAQVQGTTSVLISLELRNGRLGGLSRIETNNASATRATTRLILDLGLFDLTDSREQLN